MVSSIRVSGLVLAGLGVECSTLFVRERVFEHVFCSLRSHGTRDKAGSIIDRCYRERVSVEVFCSLRSHGTRFAYGRLRAQALSQPCLVMESKRLIQESRL